MYDWLKKNQKKLLAVIGAFLMVSFLITVPIGSFASKGRGPGAEIGHMGKTVLHEEDRQQGARLWRLLEGSYSEIHRQQSVSQEAPQGIAVPVILDLSPTFAVSWGQWMTLKSHFDPQSLSPEAMQSYFQSYMMWQQVEKQPEAMAFVTVGFEQKGLLAQIKERPELFILLVKEAEQRGIRISDDRLQGELKNRIKPDKQKIGTVDDDVYFEAVRDYLMVVALRDQFLSQVKYTDAEWDNFYARTLHEEQLNHVEFGIARSWWWPLQEVPPTEQQVQAQYAMYKDVDPDSPTKPANDPLGVGYYVPDQGKIEYLTVSRESVSNDFKSSIPLFKKRIPRSNLTALDPTLDGVASVDAGWWALRSNYDEELTGKAWTAFRKKKAEYLEKVVPDDVEASSLRVTNSIAAGQMLGIAGISAGYGDGKFMGLFRDAEPLASLAPATFGPPAPGGAGGATTLPATPATQPATATRPAPPSTAPTTLPAAPATSQAATTPLPHAWETATAMVKRNDFDLDDRLFALHIDETIGEGLKAELDNRVNEIAGVIQTTMHSGWEASRAPTPTSGPTSSPATVASAAGSKPAKAPATQPIFKTDYPYGSTEYLDKLQGFIQRQYGVLPAVYAPKRDWLSAKGLAALAGIGETTMSATVMQAAPFAKDAKADSKALQLLQPAEVVKDKHDNAYVFRLSDAWAGHPQYMSPLAVAASPSTHPSSTRASTGPSTAPSTSPSLAEVPPTATSTPSGKQDRDVRGRVEQDTITRIAYDKAKAAADKVAAEVNGGKSLAEAVNAESVPHSDPVLTEYFSAHSNAFLPAELITAGEKLVTDAKPDHPYPAVSIPLPTGQEVAVAQLNNVRIKPTPGKSPDEVRAQVQPGQMAQMGSVAEMALDNYFSFDAVCKRLGYTPEKSSKGGQ